MADSHELDEATNIMPTRIPKPPSSTGTPTWLWFVLALLALVLIGGAGFVGATIQGNTKDQTISAVENSLVQEQGTATAAAQSAFDSQSLAATVQAGLEDDLRLAEEQSADIESTAAAESEARGIQETIAAEEMSARETADAGSTAIAETAEQESERRATAEAQSTDSAATAESEAEARSTQEALAANAEDARATAESAVTSVAATSTAGIEFSATQIAHLQATEALLRNQLEDVEATNAVVSTEIVDASGALATQEGRAINNAGTAAAAQIEINRLQSTIDVFAGVPDASTPPPVIGDARNTTQLVQSDANIFSIRLPVDWAFDEVLTEETESTFYFGETRREMDSMQSDSTAQGVGGAVYFLDIPTGTVSSVENALETSIEFYTDNGGREINEPYTYVTANGDPIATQTVDYNRQFIYVYVIGFRDLLVVGLMTEPNDTESEWHSQLETIMVSINLPPISGVASGIDRSFNYNAERRGLNQTVRSSDGRLTLHLPNGWEFEDTFAADNTLTFFGDVSFGSAYVIETEDPSIFINNSGPAAYSVLTFLINRFLLEDGGHLRGEPDIFERDDGIVSVYNLVEDSLGFNRWTAVYIFENGNVVVAQVSHVGESTFDEINNQLLAIVLSLEFNASASGGSGPSG